MQKILWVGIGGFAGTVLRYMACSRGWPTPAISFPSRRALSALSVYWGRSSPFRPLQDAKGDVTIVNTGTHLVLGLIAVWGGRVLGRLIWR